MTLHAKLAGRLNRLRGSSLSAALVSAALLAAACAPAAQPGLTAAPAQSAATAAATTATGKPADSPAPVKPAEQPAAQARTQAVESFYKGKTIRIIVGSAPGGGYDTYARTIGRHIGKHIPGNPTVIVENMPGAGSLIAANHVYNVAEKDGTVIGHIQGGVFLQQLLGLEGVQFDAVKWQVLGVPSTEHPTCVATVQSGIASLREVMNPGGKQFIVGGNAPGSSTWDVPTRLQAALDLNLKIVPGYDGTSKVRLAMDQGEVDGICGWGWESLQATGLDRVQAGEYRILTQVTDKKIEAPEMADVPLALDLARTEEARQLIRLGIIVPGQILRPFLLAPDVPAERAQALRQAFGATMADPEFRADAERSKLELAPLGGQEAEQLIKDLAAMPANVKETLQKINQ